ncbi:MAG: thermonuclease family protein [Sphingopyxis sp.]|nr:thermonuclease family protein [Sphingopyxis sp.]
MSGPDFHCPQRRVVRRRKPVRPYSRVGSNLWLMLVMVIAFVASLATSQYFPGAAVADAPAIDMPFLDSDAAETADALSARFNSCHSGRGRNCVVDGDTFWFAGDKYRIADIDTPETHPARCAEEAALGEAATGRLREWLNAGAFSLQSARRDVDPYDRKLRIVTRRGESVGSVLVAEGLARPWEGSRRPWC